MEKWSNNHHPSPLSIESCIFCMTLLSRHSMSVIVSWLSKFWRLRQLAFDQGVRLAREWKSLWSLYCGGQRKTIGGGQLSLVIIISGWSFFPRFLLVKLLELESHCKWVISVAELSIALIITVITPIIIIFIISRQVWMSIWAITVQGGLYSLKK